MAKLIELKIQHLKKELEQRGLLTSGNKAELQARLREAMEAEGVDVDEYVFQLEAEESSTKVEEKAEHTGPSPGIDMSVMMAALSQMSAQMSAQISSQSSQISQLSVEMSSQMSQMSAEMSSKINAQLEVQDTRISKLEAEKTHMTSQLGTIEAEVDAVKTRLCELQLNRPTMLTSGPKVKAPSFDGTVPFPIFKLQFETTATANHWSTADKVAALVVSLKGSAAEVLQAVPEADRGNYESLMAAIERRYGSDHRQQMFQMELTSRCQRTNETLQEYATEIERLAHLAYAKETADFVEKMKCQAFIRGIRDMDTKRAVYSTPKGTFWETVSFALIQETAALLSKPVHKVHRVEVEQPTSLEETIRRIIKEFLPEMPRPSSSRVKCYNCGKTGHMARSCRIPRSQPKTSSNGRKQKTLERNHIEPRKGKQYDKADSPPRRPGHIERKDCSKVERTERVVNIRSMHLQPDHEWEPSAIRKSQLNDADLGKIMEAKDAGTRPTRTEMAKESPVAKAYWMQWNSLKIIDGVLHRVWESEDGNHSRNLIIVPKSRVTYVLEEFHNGPSGGHLGITKTLEKIKQRFYWVNCRESVAEWIRNCAECMAAKGPKERSRGRLQQYNAGSPFERVAMDVAGPFPTSDSGNKYVLVVMDYFSKWPEVYALPNQEAKTVAEVFVQNWVTRFGVPIELHSDQGRNFESAIFKEMCCLLGIRKTRTTPLHPQSDGMVERFNRTLEEHLRKVVGKCQRNWDKHIQMFLLAYRSAVHETTGQSPARIVFGSDLKLPGDLAFGKGVVSSMDEDSHWITLQDDMDELHQHVRQHTRVMSNKMKDRFDRAVNSDGFSEGSLVLLYNPQRKKGASPKLQASWEGPYKVIKRLNDVVYRIQQCRTGQGKIKVVHLERLAPFGSKNLVSNRDDQT